MSALLEVKRRVAPYLDLQLVAFPQDGVLRHPQGLALLQQALDLGVDVVGGIPHFERTMAEGARRAADRAGVVHRAQQRHQRMVQVALRRAFAAERVGEVHPMHIVSYGRDCLSAQRISPV